METPGIKKYRYDFFPIGITENISRRCRVVISITAGYDFTTNR